MCISLVFEFFVKNLTGSTVKHVFETIFIYICRLFAIRDAKNSNYKANIEVINYSAYRAVIDALVSRRGTSLCPKRFKNY